MPGKLVPSRYYVKTGGARPHRNRILQYHFGAYLPSFTQILEQTARTVWPGDHTWYRHYQFHVSRHQQNESFWEGVSKRFTKTSEASMR